MSLHPFDAGIINTHVPHIGGNPYLESQHTEIMKMCGTRRSILSRRSEVKKKMRKFHVPRNVLSTAACVVLCASGGSPDSILVCLRLV